jgi:hypothetical protein
MKILGVRWFTGASCVGIVRVDTGREIKYYIGSCTGADIGSTEEIDKEYISAYGASFPNHVGDTLFGITADDWK